MDAVSDARRRSEQKTAASPSSRRRAASSRASLRPRSDRRPGSHPVAMPRSLSSLTEWVSKTICMLEPIVRDSTRDARYPERGRTGVIRSTDSILTTHVGSLLRPIEVMRFIKAKDAQEPYDEQAFASVLDTTIDEVVRDQARAGIDIVNDGEFSRTSYANYVRDRLAGYEMKPPGGHIRATLDEVRFGNLVPGMIRDRERFGDFVQTWRRYERTMFM